MSSTAERRSLLGAALLLTASTLLSRVLGYVRDAVVAARHGAGTDTDIYFASFTLPDLMSYMLAGGALSITFLPMASRRWQEGGQDAVNRLFGVVATTMGALLLVVTVAMWVLAPMVVPRLLPGFDAAAQAETVRLTRIVLPAQLFFYVGGLAGATVMARTRFLEAALAPVVYNLAIIGGGLLLGPSMGIAGFSWGALIGAALGPCGLLLLAAHRQGLRFRPRFAPRDADFKRFVWVSLPVMAGFSLVTVDEWFGRYFATRLEPGAVSWLQNARRLMLVPVSVLGQAAGQATLPFLARLRAEGRTDEAGRVLADALRAVGFLTIIAGVGLAVLAEPLVSVFYERGAFGPTDTLATAAALAPMALGVPFWALQALSARGFYALEDTLTPMLLATGVTLLSVPLYSTLAEQGVAGLGAATSLGMAATALVTLWRLRSKLSVPLGEVAGAWARVAFVAAVAGGATWALLRGIDGRWLRAVLGGATFGGLALTGAAVLGLPELQPVLRRLRRR